MTEFFDGRTSNERKRNIGEKYIRNINHTIFNSISNVRSTYFTLEILFANFLYTVTNQRK